MNRTMLFLIVLIMIFSGSTVTAKDYLEVGRIICSEPHPDCYIIRGIDEVKCCGANILKGGDIIKDRKHDATLKIYLEPYAKIKIIDKYRRQIIYQPPEIERGLTQIVFDYLESYFTYLRRTPVHESSTFTKRVGPVSMSKTDIPQATTLIPDQPIPFLLSGIDKGTTISLEDPVGKIVYSREIGTEDTGRLTPTEMKMKGRETYLLAFPDKKFYVRLLDETTQKIIANDLSRIDDHREKGRPQLKAETLIRKASYLQIVSDMYPEGIDLYWLSAQMLPDINDIEMNSDQRAQCIAIKKRAKAHYNQ